MHRPHLGEWFDTFQTDVNNLIASDGVGNAPRCPFISLNRYAIRSVIADYAFYTFFFGIEWTTFSAARDPGVREVRGLIRRTAKTIHD